MAILKDFCLADFSQGAKLRTEYKHNKELWGGVCYALMCEWFRIAKSGENDATKRIEKVEKQLKLCGSRQKIYKDYLAAMDKAAGISWAQVATTMTAQGNLFGVEFDYRGLTQGGAVAIKDFLSAAAQKDKFFYLSIKFAQGGGHAIGVQTTRPIRVFDPNYGEHEIPTGKRTSFFNALWAKYSTLNGGIHTAIVYGMKEKQSIFDFWKDKETA